MTRLYVINALLDWYAFFLGYRVEGEIVDKVAWTREMVERIFFGSSTYTEESS